MSILTIDPFSLQLDPFPQFEYGTTTEDPFFLNQTYMSNDDMVFCDQLAFSDLDCNAPATNLGNIDMVPTEAHEKQLQHENEPESLELGAAKASSCFIAFFEAIERQNSEMKDVIRRQARRLERLEQDLAQLQVTACVSASIDKGDHESSKNTGVQQLSVGVAELDKQWTDMQIMLETYFKRMNAWTASQKLEVDELTSKVDKVTSLRTEVESLKSDFELFIALKSP